MPTVLKALDLILSISKLLYALLSRGKMLTNFDLLQNRRNTQNSVDLHIFELLLNFILLHISDFYNIQSQINAY